MSKKKYYKVTNCTNHSARATFIESLEARVLYKIDQWVYPNIKNSDLMVFETLECATNFAKGGGDKIYECEVKNPRKKGIININNFDWIDIFKALKLKKQKKKFLHLSEYSCAPSGTIFCSAVKLVKRVY